MSVVESERGVGKLRILTKAKELVVYTIRTCSNESHFPKRYRWCLTNEIVGTTIKINSLCLKANSVYVNSINDFNLRNYYQTEALAEIDSLIGLVDVAWSLFGLSTDKVTAWTRLIIEVQSLLRSWRKSDTDRYTERFNS